MAQLLIDLVPIDAWVGYWCDLCLLPSVVQVEFAMADHHTLVVYGHFLAAQCADCGTHFQPVLDPSANP